ncbi:MULTISPECIES: sugar phosphate isomerase/epimerase [unclassified Pseudofrankia]|uniref:sugar phosphate isomerase/epimerase family protein n=1 Tax=unclassified Pseudofrankia TaxID=2994372 RepID=UPI0008D96F3C|nr:MULTISPECIES: sugar phosphate isomerase/epimerase [unclassified Pseudofrankia]MDT3439237.1 sugar phosphate isomerase/epimerase [Pseudofrankia sp. BMG5.37]OHV43809.1 xylose isomerase [Pseudofrankia sp. BMG5.36]
MTVELGLTPDSRWDIDVAGLVGAAGAAGFTAVGLSVSRVDAAGAAALAAGGLRCHELLALIVTSDEEATVSHAGRLAEAAAAVKARWVLAGFRVALDQDTAPLISRCAAMFAEAGAGMAVEFTPYGGARSISDALKVVEAAGVDRAGVLIDTWHFFNGDSTWEQLERVPLERIAYVQFDDALPPISGNGVNETMHRRAMPGDGTFELDRFASTLLDRGWAGLVSVEVLNAELRQLPVSEFARQAYETTARYWR